jgi:predicted RNase H-like HicB family nuclease
VESGTKDMNIEVEFEQGSDGRWIADVPTISGAIAYGATKKEALERVIAILKESGEKESMNAAEVIAKQYANAQDLADQ